ncbi:MAG TPA: polyprenyl synthetase family protein [Candidatus Pullichristensenella avicola]|nr:polyprenyl synthetase family protein [Candidatus Pullichristensenella avicola]
MTTLKEYAARVETRLDQLLPGGGAIVNDAMRYSVMAGGKRLRPAMLLAAAEMLGGAEEALDFACAVEMIHTYSLIHDDLPGMDDDTLRRGRPTNHVVYGVGQAILAGDGLLNAAFEVMLAASLADAGRSRPCLEAMAEIARGAGVRGMILGQCFDLDSERNGVPASRREEMLETIQQGKTACMFIYPLRAACRLCGADEAETAALTAYGAAFGLLFQATDDLLDVTGDSAEVGKTLGKDEKSGKLTCISVYGVEKTRSRVEEEHVRAVAALERFGARAAFLRKLVDDMVGRTK